MKRRESGLLKISEIAEKAGVLPSTIRHYTDLGLIRYATTTEGGHRLYEAQETLGVLARIKRLSGRGVSLPDIRAELSGKGRRRILVVDDEIEVGEFITDLLKEKLSVEVRVALDGFSAGRMVAEFMPELVVLDLMLPGVDGFGVCRQIRGDVALGGTKILAVTGYDTAENRSKILEAGADKLLAKPLEAREVLRAVGELLGVKWGAEEQVQE